MLRTNESVTDVSAEQQHQGLMERLIIFTLTTVPCCVFLFINGTMLFALRSKSVFCETSRYVLLFNLLFADTVQMALSQVMYIIAFCHTRLTYPVCGFLSKLTVLTNDISPLTLVVMSLERYVAVCYPLRHAAIATIRNTGISIMMIWAFSSLNVLIRIILLLNFPFDSLESLQMRDYCSNVALVLDPVTDVYDKAYTCFVFVSAAVVVISSFISVMVAARSASTDKASTQKARNTLLLHLVQLGLSVLSTINNPVLIAIARSAPRIIFVRIANVLYMCFFIVPRCLSSLIYGIRDQTIRPVLMYYICCQMKGSVVPNKPGKKSFKFSVRTSSVGVVFEHDKKNILGQDQIQ